MIEKTRGIVLHSIRYGDTSLVVRVFTRSHGMQSYLMQGVRKSKARIRQNLFQPLTRVEMVVYHKEHGGLQRIKEIHCPEPYHSIPYDIIKTSIAIFLAEMLTNALKEADSSPAMFDFVSHALENLDKATGRISEFHLVFMMQLTSFLGFFPASNFDDRNCYFNLKEGTFQAVYHGPEMCLDQEASRHFHQVVQAGFENLEQLHLSAAHRKNLLHNTIDYYRWHLEGLKTFRSHLVLESVLH
jgi:DNA repair protein RecO (recombination protein O)